MKRRIKVAIAALLLVVAYLLVAWCLFYQAPAQQIPEWSPTEKKWVQERMKHHGIDAAILDRNGYHFYRNGRRCRL